MENNFIKDSFESNLGYVITHTRGQSAENSTISQIHQVPHFILYYFIKGSGTIKIEGKNYNISAGNIVLLNTEEMFCCSIDKNKYHERIVLHIDIGLFKQFPKECERFFSPFLDREGKGERNIIDAETVTNCNLDTLAESILFYAKKDGAQYEMLTLCKLIEFLHHLSEAMDNKPSIKSTQNSTVNAILDFLNNNFSRQITIDDISGEFNLDKSYLSHLFKEYVGISMWNYVIFRRISHFNTLIRKGYSIENASREAGFNNYSNFFRLYKKQMGITPTQYKRENT